MKIDTVNTNPKITTNTHRGAKPMWMPLLEKLPNGKMLKITESKNTEYTRQSIYSAIRRAKQGTKLKFKIRSTILDGILYIWKENLKHG